MNYRIKKLPQVALIAMASGFFACAGAAEGTSARTYSAITPVFSQLVEFSIPPHFKVANQSTNAGNYIQESVLQGESVDRWSQMITLTGKRGASTTPQASPQAYAENIAHGFQQACPSTFAIAEPGARKIDGREAFVVIASCGSVREGNNGHSESAIIVAVRGSADFYTIQWAVRGTESAKPLTLDPQVWADRIGQLDPIRICPIVPGEPEPYPSCSKRNP